MRSLTNCEEKKGVIPWSIAGTRTGNCSRPAKVDFIKSIDKNLNVMEENPNYLKPQ